jgi:predicted enzyme related to lactoylglutathione lyase
MEKVTGIGGIMFKAEDPKGMREWYGKHLGIAAEEWGAVFRWREHDDPSKVGATAWNMMKTGSTYFDPTTAPFMINYRVRDLDAMIAQLRAAGVQVDEKVEDTEFGKFGWARDPEGRRFELWQPPADEA